MSRYNEHCLHETGRKRICCWCGMMQSKVLVHPDGHGDYAPKGYCWQPPMAGSVCTGRVDEGFAKQVPPDAPIGYGGIE